MQSTLYLATELRHTNHTLSNIGMPGVNGGTSLPHCFAVVIIKTIWQVKNVFMVDILVT